MSSLAELWSIDDTDYADASPSVDPIYSQIRALSHEMAPIRQRVNSAVSNMSNADAAIDFDQLTADVQTLDQQHARLVQLIQMYKASPAYQADAQTAALLDHWLAFAGEWARSTIAAIPDTLAGVTDGLANIVANTTASVFKGLTPLLIGAAVLALGAIALAKRAETTRTYRRLVA